MGRPRDLQGVLQGGCGVGQQGLRCWGGHGRWSGGASKPRWGWVGGSKASRTTPNETAFALSMLALVVRVCATTTPPGSRLLTRLVPTRRSARRSHLPPPARRGRQQRGSSRDQRACKMFEGQFRCGQGGQGCGRRELGGADFDGWRKAGFLVLWPGSCAIQMQRTWGEWPEGVPRSRDAQRLRRAASLFDVGVCPVRWLERDLAGSAVSIGGHKQGASQASSHSALDSRVLLSCWADTQDTRCLRISAGPSVKEQKSL